MTDKPPSLSFSLPCRDAFLVQGALGEVLEWLESVDLEDSPIYSVAASAHLLMDGLVVGGAPSADHGGRDGDDNDV